MRDRKGMDLRGRKNRKELGGVEGWEPVTRMYYVKGKNPVLIKVKIVFLKTQQNFRAM